MVAELCGGLQAHHLGRQLSVVPGGMGRSERDADGFGHRALSCRRTRPHQIVFIGQISPAGMTDSIQFGKDGVVGQTTDGPCGGPRQVKTVAESVGLPCLPHHLDNRVEQCGRDAELTRSRRHPARQRHAEHLRRTRQFCGLPVQLLGLLACLPDPPGEQQCIDVGVGDDEPRVRCVERTVRDAIPHARGSDGLLGTAGVTTRRGHRPGGHRTHDGGKNPQIEAGESTPGPLRSAHRRPVHRVERVDAGRGRRRDIRRRIVDVPLGAFRVGERPQHVGSAQECQPGPSVIGELIGMDGVEHRVRFLTPTEPRQGMGPNELRFGTASSGDRPLGQPVSQRQVRQPHRPLSGPGQ
nr:hypothetical protein CPGR_00794 [Mycolicibacterium fortuitum subsp. fortuitum DSM 46621 = ATCC 6841 = JCM 6387]